MAFCGYLKQSTAVDIMLGPFVDETDGKTAETGLTIAQADVRLSKNGANMAQKNDAASCTHDEIGIYKCDLNTTDTGTLGLLDVMIHESGALPVHQTYQVVIAHWWDTMCGSDYLQVDAIQIEGTDATAVLDTQIDDRLDTAIPGGPTAGSIFERIKSLDDGYTSTRAGYLDELAAASIPADLDAVLADTNELQTDLVNGGRLDLLIDAILADTGELQTDDIPGTLSTMDGKLDTIDNFLDTEIAAILAGTVLLSTTIGSDNRSTTSCELAAGSDNNDVYIGCLVILDDDAGDGEYVARTVTDYVGASRTLTWSPAITENAEDGGNIYIVPGDTLINVTAATILADTNELQTDDIPGTLADMAGATFATGTDSLEAIRNRGDAAWTTGGGTGLTALATGTAQGGTSSTIQLASGETFANDELNGNVVKITGGTGDGQSRLITDYVGATDTATVAPNWTTTPDATSTYEIVAGQALVVQVVTGAIDNSALATGAISAAKIASDAITGGKIADGAISADQLANSAAAEIADAVWDEALADHDSEDSIGNVINDLTEESGGTYRFTSAALQSTLGAGSITFTYTLTSSVDSAPIASATVWVTTDEAGSNVVASGTTDTSGQVVFYLDAGTYYVWREKAGWNFTNPDTEAVA